MIDAPVNVLAKLKSGSLSYANLVTINLGDAYDTGSDFIIYLTDYGFDISFNGNLYVSDNNLAEITGISRKASVGSDSVDISFSVTDANLIAAIKAERYINKPTSIERVLVEDGSIIDDFSIPVRTAWGISHSIDGDIEDRVITLKIDGSLGNLMGDNGWFAINASHQARFPNDYIMQHSATVMSELQQSKYTSNFSGVINEEVKPPAVPVIYGYKNVELVPILRLTHRKSHTSYRHYFTTWIYVISAGSVEEIDIQNLKKDGEPFDFKFFSTPDSSGGWCCGIRTPERAEQVSILDDPNLGFWLTSMDSNERDRLIGMFGKGLTCLFIRDRNRDNWKDTPKLTVPVKGIRVYDPRIGSDTWSRNPALQYADYLRSTTYGAGKKGIDLLDSNIIEIADHFDSLPGSIGNDGINSISTDIQLDTALPISENMEIWIEGVRLYTSDYYGIYKLRVETQSPIALSINEDELENYPKYESGDFTDRLNQLTYTIKQLVPDESDNAEPGDLVEVDVESTFPEDGTPIHTQWLSEDSGIANSDSGTLDYVTELEQAYYWTMVDARISRQPRELEITLGPIGWLIEVGDVISFTSEIIDETDQLWRVEEVSEDETAIELNLIAYDDDFYSPEPNSIPDPTPFAQPPTKANLVAVSDLKLVYKNGKYYLDWLPLEESNIDWYAVEVTLSGAIAYDDPRFNFPPFLLNDIGVGSYQATVTPFGFGAEGEEDSISFFVDIPPSGQDVVWIIGSENGILVPLRNNILQDSGTYYLPFANSVESGVWIEIELSDKYSNERPLVMTQGSELIAYHGETDNNLDFDGGATGVKLVSNGVDTWMLLAVRGQSQIPATLEEQQAMAGFNQIYRTTQEYILHRSLSDDFPENTLIAASMALNRTQGQNVALELDVQITQDGVPVVFHDTTVDSLTNGSGEIKTMLLSEVKALKFTDLVGTAFEDYVHIPTYDEYVRFAASKGIKLYAETKHYRSDDDIALMLEVTTKYRYAKNTVYSSFRMTDLQKVRALNADCGVGYAPSGVVSQSDLSALRAMGKVTMFAPLSGSSGLLLNPDDVGIYYDNGFEVAAWTVNTSEEVEKLTAIGVQRFITDIQLVPPSNISSSAIEQRFNQSEWAQSTSGDGSIVFGANPENAQTVGDTATLNAGSGSEAILKRGFQLTAGSNMTFSIMAAGNKARPDDIDIELHLPDGTLKNKLRIFGDELIEYSITMQVPINETFDAYDGSIVIGSDTSVDAGVFIYRPMLRKSNSLYVNPEVVMSGVLTIAKGGVAGAHEFNPNSKKYNTDTITVNGNEIDIRPHKESDTAGGLGVQQSRCFIQPFKTGFDIKPLIFTADCHNPQGIISLSAYDAVSGSEVNLNTVTTEYLVYFEVKI